jgi:hypothetical protein
MDRRWMYDDATVQRAEISIAISLKRIADQMEKQTQLAEASLKEIQRQSHPQIIYDENGVAHAV